MLTRGMFNLIEGDFISRYAQAYGEWSDLEVRFLLNNLRADSTVVEVGSNIGMHAIPIARHIERGKLFCFEPQRVIFQTLCANISLNSLTNVYAYQEGVGDENAWLEIPSSDYETEWNYGSFPLDKGFDTESSFNGIRYNETIRLTALDRHPELQKLNALDLLKIDAEGFESHVLNGAKRLIEQHKPIIFAEAQPDDCLDLIRHFERMDYRCYWFASHRYQEDNFFRRPESLSGIDLNLACFHRDAVPSLPEKLSASVDSNLDFIPLIIREMLER